MVRDGLELVEERLFEALDEVATIKAEVADKALRSRKQPPAKVRYDKKHYSTASTRLSVRDYERLREICEAQGHTVSEMFRGFAFSVLGK